MSDDTLTPLGFALDLAKTMRLFERCERPGTANWLKRDFLGQVETPPACGRLRGDALANGCEHDGCPMRGE